jgi:uncharacterized delta-60 repeat protein
LGRLPLNAQTADSFNPGANNFVLALAEQGDRGILVAGQFTNLAGQSQSRIGRLFPDGTLDTSFFTSADDSVWSLAVEPDARPLAGGDFVNFSGQPTRRLGRLNLPGGGADGAFNPWPNGTVRSVAVQPDGMILVGGSFSYISFNTQPYLARLQAGSLLDTNFLPVLNGPVYALALQTDGKILVGGAFTTVNTLPRCGLVRLNPDGSVDTTFNASLNTTNTGVAYALLVQKDGRIVLGGGFTTVNGQPCTNLARLSPDGSPDPAFSASSGAIDGSVYALSLQSDGKLIMGGAFRNILGQPRIAIARLYPDGSLDPDYSPGEGFSVIYAQALQMDGKLVLGGGFTSMAGQPRANIARLNPLGPATNNLTFDTNSIDWARGGSATEVLRTTFDYTTDGVDWTALGEGSRTPTGWLVTGLNLPTNTIVRARGYVCGGSWFVESLAGQPLFLSQPLDFTCDATLTAVFSASGNGGSPLSYRWLKNGVPVNDGGNVTGSQTQMLILTNVFGADAGQYQVVLSNAWGSVTSRVATLTVLDPVITAQSGNQSVAAGLTVDFSVYAIGTAPLLYQWSRNGAPLATATNWLLTLTNVQASDAASYSVVVSNSFGTRTSAVASLTVNLSLPDGFNPGSRGPSTQVMLQPDGKVVASGLFGAANTPRYLARFNPDGSLDPGFTCTNVGDISCLALQTDGRILVTGLPRYTGIPSVPGGLGRLTPDGRVDAGFTNQIFGSINGLVLRPDGELWAGGSFSYLKPAILTNLALVQPNGAVDTNFVGGVNGTLFGLALQPDGKLVAGGSFTLANGQTATRLARFTAAGASDTNFNASANNTVYCALVQPDGRILVAGSFTSLDGVAVSEVGRLNADGTLDTAFNPNVNNTVDSMALQADGKIIIAGSFTAVSGSQRNHIARLNPDGSPDLTFNPNANGTVYAVGLQADGAIIAAGNFSTLTGQYRANIGRLLATEPATQALSYDGANLNWVRGGTCPEVWRVTFEISTNGANWSYLGAGERVTGGWRLVGVDLPSQANARARGFVTGGQNNAGSWFVESTLGPALVMSQPASRTNLAGTTASFWVSGSGTPPLSYQWLKAGQPLADGGNLSGSSTRTLTLSNVLGGDMGGYSVVVSNASGSITSSVAYLTVIEPIITSQPVSVYTNAGQPASFSVAAIGTAPLQYQWRKNGTNLAGATGAALAFTGAQKDDIAGYSVVVTTAYGSVTSSVATLTLNLALPDALAPALNDEVRSLVTQPDGKIYIGGNFNHLGADWFYGFGRLNADGSRDTNFNGHMNSGTDTVAVQSDGNILAGGWFTSVNDSPHSYICRFYPDGTLDPLNPAIAASTLSPSIESLVPQPDGKFLIGGWFTSLAGQANNYVGRFNANGTADALNVIGANDYVQALALQPDGKVVVAGRFTALGGQTRNRIGRLNADGTLDTTFDPNANAVVNAVVMQPDGRILVGGSFTTIGGVGRTYLARLNTDGTVDATLNVSLSGGVSGLALQTDGSIILAGVTAVAGQARSGLARVSAAGVLDTTWSPQVGGGVGGVSIQPDGGVLLCGSFSSICGQPRANLARVEAVGTADHCLAFDATGASWLRGGVSPEVSGVGFDYSADGTNWTSLGARTRIPGGWRVNTSLLATNIYVRARGFHSGGRWNGSLSLIADVAQVSPLTPPVILSSDPSFGFQTNQFRFTVRALPGQATVLEASTNLVDWVPLQTNLLTSAAQFIFADSHSGVYPRRFYRARIDPDPLPPPAMSLHRPAPYAPFGFNLSGIVGQTVVVEASTNLLTWTPLATNELGVVPLSFTDLGSTNFPSRFYRARPQ